MAQSRLEKIGTIYDRLTSLIKAGAVKEESRPLWIDIYKAFPPKYEPRYDRPPSSAPIRQIFYPEDKLRARFHKEYKHFSLVNLANNSVISRTEQFLMIYKNLEKTGVPEAELYDKAIQEFVAKFNAKRTQKDTKPEQTKVTVDSAQRKEVFQMLDQWSNQEDGEQKSNELTEEEKTKYRPIRLSMEKIAEIMKEEKKPE